MHRRSCVSRLSETQRNPPPVPPQVWGCEYLVEGYVKPGDVDPVNKQVFLYDWGGSTYCLTNAFVTTDCFFEIWQPWPDGSQTVVGVTPTGTGNGNACWSGIRQATPFGFPATRTWSVA